MFTPKVRIPGKIYLINKTTLDTLLCKLYIFIVNFGYRYKIMVNQDQKEKILRFVLKSSQEENQRLARFMAGIEAQKGENPGLRQSAPAPDPVERRETKEKERT
jgi:hypothetical protein